MNYFTPFFVATIAILLGILTIGSPILFIIRVYLILKEPFVSKYSNIEDLEEQPETVLEMFIEFKEYLEKQEQYEDANIVHQAYVDFQRKKTTVENVFEKFDITSEWIDEGDNSTYPERKGVLLDSFTNDELKSSEYGFLRFRKGLTIKEFFKRLLFS